MAAGLGIDLFTDALINRAYHCGGRQQCRPGSSPYHFEGPGQAVPDPLPCHRRPLIGTAVASYVPAAYLREVGCRRARVRLAQLRTGAHWLGSVLSPAIRAGGGGVRLGLLRRVPGPWGWTPRKTSSSARAPGLACASGPPSVGFFFVFACLRCDRGCWSLGGRFGEALVARQPWQ